MNTYKTLKRVLDNGNKDNAVTIEKLDIFLIGNRITDKEYKELVEILNSLESEE